MRFLMLPFLVAGLAFLGGPGAGLAGAEPPPGAAATRGVRPLAENAWNDAKARHLLFRAGWGGPPEEVAQLQQLGVRKAVESLVGFRSQPDVNLPFDVKKPELPDPAELRKLSQAERQKLNQQQRRDDQQRLVRLREWWVRRMLQSPRQLQEKLVLFWHGHFATEYRTVRSSQALYQQHQLFREHADNFEKLLRGIVHDPAMLRYLDNNRNVKGRPNENLAREILELFSMGEGNYTEQDIKEAARALTGYTFDREEQFRFAAAAHDNGPKTIFGQSGNWDGDQLVTLILKQPATARFIARKLFIYFAHDNPANETIEHLAQILRRCDYNLAPMLQALFLSEEFYSPSALGTQIKGPAQQVIGTLRTLGLSDAEPAAVVAALRSMGQELFEPPNVRGWEGGRAWINTNTALARDNFAVLLFAPQSRTPAKAKTKAPRQAAAVPRAFGVQLDLAARLLQQKLTDGPAIADYFTHALLATPIAEAERALLLKSMGTLPPPGEWEERRAEVNNKLSALIMFIMSMPAYQLT